MRRRSRTRRRRRRLAKYVLADFVFIRHACLSLFSALSLFLPIFIRSLLFSFFSNRIDLFHIDIIYHINLSLYLQHNHSYHQPRVSDLLTDAALRIGATQILFMDTPVYAAVSETVEVLRMHPKIKISYVSFYIEIPYRRWCTVFIPDTASTIVISVPFFFFSFGFLHLLLLFPSPVILSQQ